MAYNTNTILILNIIHNPWQHKPSPLLLSLVSLIGFDSWAGSIGQALTGAEWQSVPDSPFWLSLPWEITSHSCPRILTQSTWLWSGTAGKCFLMCVCVCLCTCAHGSYLGLNKHTYKCTPTPLLSSPPIVLCWWQPRHYRTCRKPINKAGTEAACQQQETRVKGETQATCQEAGASLCCYICPQADTLIDSTTVDVFIIYMFTYFPFSSNVAIRAERYGLLLISWYSHISQYTIYISVFWLTWKNVSFCPQ